MALGSLRHADQATRSSALSAAAAVLLPDPSIGTHSYDSRGGTLVDAVIDEIAKKLPAGRDAGFRSALMQKIIAKELKEQLLSGAKISDIRDRVGQKGLLSPSQYQTVFRTNFINLNVPMGVSKTLALSAISKPLGVDHLFPEEHGLFGLKAHSLFTGSVPGRSDCCVVICTTRNNALLEIDGGWLVFYQDVGIDRQTSPVETLRALAMKYGLPVTSGKTTSKFILMETSEIELHRNVENAFAIENAAPHVDFRASFSLSPGRAQIGLVFAINLVEYIAALKEHGINVTRKLTGVMEIHQYVQSSKRP